jgi:hypothetical protein
MCFNSTRRRLISSRSALLATGHGLREGGPLPVAEQSGRNALSTHHVALADTGGYLTHTFGLGARHIFLVGDEMAVS